MPRETSARKSPRREAANGAEKPARAATRAPVEPPAPTRYEHLDPIQLFTLLPIRVYHHIADIGAGQGYLTLPLAKYAYDGKVFAIDAQESNLDVVKERVSLARLSNVAVLQGKDGKIPLEDGSVDGVVMSPVLHESKQPVALLREVGRILRADGWIATIEWVKASGSDGPSPDQLIPRPRAVKLAQEAGLRVITQRDLNSYFYFILLKKIKGTS